MKKTAIVTGGSRDSLGIVKQLGKDGCGGYHGGKPRRGIATLEELTKTI